MPAAYRWEITKDLIKDPMAPEGTNSNAVGLVGPRNAPDVQTFLSETGGDTLRHKTRSRFAMYDDDGECYYEGVIYGDYDGFEPLDDFGGPNAGCTAIKMWWFGK